MGEVNHGLGRRKGRTEKTCNPLSLLSNPLGLPEHTLAGRTVDGATLASAGQQSPDHRPGLLLPYRAQGPPGYFLIVRQAFPKLPPDWILVGTE
jgi:hypothetical protein